MSSDDRVGMSWHQSVSIICQDCSSHSIIVLLSINHRLPELRCRSSYLVLNRRSTCHCPHCFRHEPEVDPFIVPVDFSIGFFKDCNPKTARYRTGSGKNRYVSRFCWDVLINIDFCWNTLNVQSKSNI